MTEKSKTVKNVRHYFDTKDRNEEFSLKYQIQMY